MTSALPPPCSRHPPTAGLPIIRRWTCPLLLLLSQAAAVLCDEPPAVTAPSPKTTWQQPATEPASASVSPSNVATRPLILAFSSLRDRPAFAAVYFYRHDGVSQGELLPGPPQQPERSDTHSSLTADGTICLSTSKQVGGFGPRVQLYDRQRSTFLPEPPFNDTFAARTEATLSADGRWIVLSAWDQAGQPGGWDLLLYDRHANRFVDLPGLNTAANEREPAISPDGRWITYVTDRPTGAGLSDVGLYDREAASLVELPGLNTPHRELNPVPSPDGQHLAFISNRPGGAGGKDLYLYDRSTRQVRAPAGLNSAGHEQTPRFSPDGRYLVFVSERSTGPGERDLFLYDLLQNQLLPTPGLNSPAEDFDPAIAQPIVAPASPISPNR
ncbi:MAG: TolB family protein [Planctomycetaceae bacterium]